LPASDCIADCVRLAVPQPAEWEHIGYQIDVAMIFARGELRKRAWNAARSFFVSERLRPAVLNVGSVDMILVKEHIVELALTDHLSTSALVEVAFLGFAQLVKVSGIHFS
jgi:hypothetical protein